MDGVPGVTQCPILPNQSYVYTYSTNEQSGTYWYHSHYAMQYGDGLKGVLIIKDPNDPWKSFYEDEEVLQLTDWYHTPAHIHLQSYLFPGTLDPIPDTGLINGIGQFNCRTNQTCSYYRASIRSGKTKRFRIINTSVYARITLTIDQHEMKLIEADGIYLDGNKYVRSIRLTPGQRYSVLITGKMNYSKSYWIRATIHPFIDYNNNYNSSIQSNVRAILQYINKGSDHLQTIVPSIDTFDNDASIINQSFIQGEIFTDELGLIPVNNKNFIVPNNKNPKTFIYNSQHKGQNPGYFYLNNQTFTHPTNSSLLSSILFRNSKEFNWPATVKVENDEIIEVIINNIDFAPHPFHLRGHHVWILAQGNTKDGYLNQSTFKNIIYNKINPIYRDTFTVNPFSYVIVRFKTDNPGLWMLHCHNDWHLQLGMALVVIESSEKMKDYYFNNNLTNYTPSQCLNHS